MSETITETITYTGLRIRKTDDDVTETNIYKITNDFLDSLKYNIIFKIRNYNNKAYYVLQNPVFCQMFWTKYFHDIIAPNFQRQKMITFGEGSDLDLTIPVWIDVSTRELFKPPEFIKSVLYFSNILDTTDSVAFFTINSFFVLIISIILLIIITAFCSFKPKFNLY